MDDYFSDMTDAIILGDSLEIVKEFPRDSVHAIISDIPDSIRGHRGDIFRHSPSTAYGGSLYGQAAVGWGSMSWDEAERRAPLEYQAWCAVWAADWLRVLKPGGSCFLLAGRRYAHRCIAAMEDAGFRFKDMLAWEKDAPPQPERWGAAEYGYGKRESGKEPWAEWKFSELYPLFEPILWFQKPCKTGDSMADNLRENEVGAWNEAALWEYNARAGYNAAVSNVLKVPPTASDRGRHPEQKPLQLMELLISLVTVEGQVVLDPFMGSGTTCLAAKKLKRHYLGIELEPQSFQAANERLNLLSGRDER